MSRRRDQGIVLEPFPQDPPPLPAPKPARCTCDRCPTPGGPPMSTDRPATTDQQPKAYGATQTESFEMTNRVASAWNRALDAGAQLVDPTGIELSPEVFAAWWEAEARRIALRVTRELAEIGAARVSEAAGDAQSLTPDVGAAQGGEGGSATESELRTRVFLAIAAGLMRYDPGYTREAVLHHANQMTDDVLMMIPEVIQ